MQRYDNRPIYVLPDVTGLQAWTDYLPVQAAGAGRASSYDDAGGFHATEVLDDVTGLAAWVDYVPVYAAGSTPWVVSEAGYIPYDEITQSAVLMESGDTLLLESGGLLLL